LSQIFANINREESPGAPARGLGYEFAGRKAKLSGIKQQTSIGQQQADALIQVAADGAVN
jgi:hypothetical protein